jgi:hypothetical protein
MILPMKHSTRRWLLPLALLASQPATADFTSVFYDPCDGCTYPDGGWDRPAGYPAANPGGYTAAQGQYFGGNGSDGLGGVVPGADIVGTEESFDVLSMTVSQAGANLVVTVLTRFTETKHNLPTTDPSYSKIIFGDLMVATGAVGNTWKPHGSAPYAQDDAGNSGTNWNYAVDTQTGHLYHGSNAMLMNTDDPGASAYYDGLAFRANQYMQYDTGGTNVASLGVGAGQGVDVQDAVLPDSIDGSGPSDGTSLTYTIPLAALGIVALSTPTEVALRWTMTCANDIVEAAVGIPEPTSLSLFLGGLAGLRLLRRSQRAAKGAALPG